MTDRAGSGNVKALLVPHMDTRGRKGGGERYFLKLAEHLRPLGVDVAEWDDLMNGRVDYAPYDVVHTAACGLKLVGRVRRDMRRQGAKGKLLATVHAPPLGEMRHGWETGRGGVYRVGQLGVYAWQLAASTWVLNTVDGIIPVSECTAEGVRRQLPWAADRIHLNENGVDAAHFTPPPEYRNDGFLLFVGRIERSKGVDTLVDAVSDAPYRVVIAGGQGALSDELKRRAGKNVEFRGEVDEDELLDLYRRAAACVFPSLYEGYGLVALESLACGTPAAVSDAFCVRGPAERLLEWFPRGDVDALRAAVDRAMRVKTPEWSARAADTVRDHHDVRLRVQELYALYVAVANGRA